MVNVIDQLHVPWEKVFNQSDGPFLKSFWKHGMVGVGECVVYNVPRLVICHVLFIDQDS